MNFKTLASLFCLEEILPEKAKKDEKVPPVGNRWLGTATGNRSNGWMDVEAFSEETEVN